MRYLIIGNGAAGNAAAAAIVAMDPAGEVIIVTDEPQPAYYRPLITNLLEDGSSKDIFFHNELRSPTNVEVQLGKRIVALDAGLKQVTFQDRTTCSFDRLLLATGATAMIPNIPGLAGYGNYVLRTLTEAQALAQAAREAKHVVVIGGGRVGLKAALALRHRGLEVTLVEQGPYLAPMQFDAVAGEILGQTLESEGMRLIFGQTVKEVERTGDRIKSLALADGRVLETDTIVSAVGVRPNMELAAKTGVAINHGILVDSRLRTSLPDIYAAGDVAETTDIVTGKKTLSGLWTNAVEMGRIAGRNMAGAATEYPGAFTVLNSLEVAGIPTMAIGVTNPPAGEKYQVYQRRRGNNYRKLILKDEILVGALLIGDIEGAGVYTGIIRRKVKIKMDLDEIDRRRSVIASWLFRTRSLPRQK